MASSSTSAQAGNNQCGKKEMKNKRNDRGVALNRRRRQKNKLLPPVWSAQEDAILLEYVSSHGPWEWKLISKQIVGRSADGCRNRWWEQLFPDTNTNQLIKQQAIAKMKDGVKEGKKFGRLPKQIPKEVAARLNPSKNRRILNRRMPTFCSARLNPVSLPTTGNIEVRPATEPSPPSPHPRLSPIPPQPSSPSPSPSPLSQPLPQPTFIDFLGVGSV